MSKVYLAMYKAKGNWVDKIIRLFTVKPYSHCELAVAKDDKYLCYSSSPRDGGVRYKAMRLSEDKWDLIPITGVSVAQIAQFYDKTVSKNMILSGRLVACYRFAKSQADIIAQSGVMRRFLVKLRKRMLARINLRKFYLIGSLTPLNFAIMPICSELSTFYV